MELLRSGGVRGVAALRRQVSVMRPNGALSVSSRSGTTKRQIRSDGFVQGLRAKRSPDRPFGEQLPFDSSTVAERRRFEIVNPTTLNAPTLELASRLRRHREDRKYIALSSVNARARVSTVNVDGIPCSGRKCRPAVAVTALWPNGFRWLFWAAGDTRSTHAITCRE